MPRTHRLAARQAAIEADEPTLSEQDGIRYLHFNSEWVQGAMRVARPSELVLAYTQQMMAWLLFLSPSARDHIGILGLGAGALLRFTLRHTRSQVVSVERNPAVLAVCRAYFRLSDSARSAVDLADAADWVSDPQRASAYRVLMVDLYDSQAQGPVCGDFAFYSDCFRALDEPGILTVNLFGDHDSYQPNVQALHQAFSGQILCLPEIDEGNTVVLAFKGHVLSQSATDLLNRAAQVESRTGLPAQRLARTLLASMV